MRATTTTSGAAPRTRPARPGRGVVAAATVAAGVSLASLLGLAAPAEAAAAPHAVVHRAKAPAVRKARAGRVRVRRSRGRRVRAVQAYPGSAAAPDAVKAAIDAAFPPEAREKAYLVTWRESRWSATATNGKCFGLFQLSPVHTQRAAALGYSWSAVRTQLVANAVVAADVYREQGWRPWRATAY